jgi:hypothetical protein
MHRQNCPARLADVPSPGRDFLTRSKESKMVKLNFPNREPNGSHGGGHRNPKPTPPPTTIKPPKHPSGSTHPDSVKV